MNKKRLTKSFFPKGKQKFFLLFVFLFISLAAIIALCTVFFTRPTSETRSTRMILAKSKKNQDVLLDSSHDSPLRQGKDAQNASFKSDYTKFFSKNFNNEKDQISFYLNFLNLFLKKTLTVQDQSSSRPTYQQLFDFISQMLGKAKTDLSIKTTPTSKIDLELLFSQSRSNSKNSTENIFLFFLYFFKNVFRNFFVNTETKEELQKIDETERTKYTSENALSDIFEKLFDGPVFPIGLRIIQKENCKTTVWKETLPGSLKEFMGAKEYNKLWFYERWPKKAAYNSWANYNLRVRLRCLQLKPVFVPEQKIIKPSNIINFVYDIFKFLYFQIDENNLKIKTIKTKGMRAILAFYNKAENQKKTKKIINTFFDYLFKKIKLNLFWNSSNKESKTIKNLIDQLIDEWKKEDKDKEDEEKKTDKKEEEKDKTEGIFSLEYEEDNKWKNFNTSLTAQIIKDFGYEKKVKSTLLNELLNTYLKPVFTKGIEKIMTSLYNFVDFKLKIESDPDAFSLNDFQNLSSLEITKKIIKALNSSSFQKIYENIKSKFPSLPDLEKLKSNFSLFSKLLEIKSEISNSLAKDLINWIKLNEEVLEKAFVSEISPDILKQIKNENHFKQIKIRKKDNKIILNLIDNFNKKHTFVLNITKQDKKDKHNIKIVFHQDNWKENTLKNWFLLIDRKT